MYFLEGGPPVTKVVIKPLLSDTDSPEKTQLGDEILTALNVPVVQSRIVVSGTPEFADILSALGEAAAAKERAFVYMDDDQESQLIRREIFQFEHPSKARAFKVMEAVAGESIRDLSQGKQRHGRQEKSVTFDDVARLSDVLLNEATWKTIGAMMVADALMGNFDRVNYQKMNLGNILVRAGTTDLVAIDTAASLDPIKDVKRDAWQMQGLLQKLGDKKQIDHVVKMLVDSVLGDVQSAPVKTQQAVELVRTLVGFREYFERVLREGVMDALKRAYDAFLVPGAPRRRIRAQASTRYGESPSEGVSHERLLANTAYALAYSSVLNAGMSEADAHRIAHEVWANAVDLYREPALSAHRGRSGDHTG